MVSKRPVLQLQFTSLHAVTVWAEKATVMKVRKILFTTDFSHYSQTALDLATSLARDRGAELIVLHVQDLLVDFGGGEMYSITEPANKEAARQLKAVVPADPSVRFQHRLIVGPPAPSILKLADEEQVDMIVMATHGRTGMSRLLMGSVAEEVVRNANCPVLTVKSSEPQETPAQNRH